MKRVVFISHSSANRAIADRLCTYLEQNGVGCWIAPRDVTPGKNYGAAIVDAIDECRVFVLILSSEANKSRQVVREVERAASSDSVILPFRTEDVQPSRDLAFYVSAAHWLDAANHPVDEQFDELLAAIRNWQGPDPADVEKAPPPLPLATAPPPVTESKRTGSRRLIVFLTAGVAAAILIGASAFYKLYSTKQKPVAGPEVIMAPSPALTPTPPPTSTPTPEPSITPTATPEETPTPAPTSTPTASPTATPIRLKPGERLRPNVLPESTVAPEPAASPQTTIAPLSASASPPLPKRPVVREVAASSSLDTEHRPNYAFDGNPTTGWLAKEGGKGQTLFAHFKSPVEVKSVSILNGDGRDEEHNRAASRIKTLRILLSDGTNQLLTFKDEMKAQTFRLKTPVTANWVKFEIVSVYPGKTKQAGIYEITFNVME